VPAFTKLVSAALALQLVKTDFRLVNALGMGATEIAKALKIRRPASTGCSKKLACKNAPPIATKDRLNYNCVISLARLVNGKAAPLTSDSFDVALS
jgi:hypothetical protein